MIGLRRHGSTYKGSIFVATYSRPDDLRRCLTDIVAARGTKSIPLVVIHQLGFDEISNVINEFRTEIQTYVQITAQGETALENINLNSLLGREIAFTWLGADWCLGVEDDVQISADSIEFIEAMFEKYRAHPFFRGVNLGSKNPFNVNKLSSYAKMSFGMHGQASMITRKTWSHFNPVKLRLKAKVMGLDAMMEHYTKTGFMCTPFNSRYLDNGWNGTHSSTDPNDRHYQLIRESFYDGKAPRPTEYTFENFDTNWRADSKKFSYLRIIPTLISNKLGHYRYLIRKFSHSTSNY